MTSFVTLSVPYLGRTSGTRTSSPSTERSPPTQMPRLTGARWVGSTLRVIQSWKLPVMQILWEERVFVLSEGI